MTQRGPRPIWLPVLSQCLDGVALSSGRTICGELGIHDKSILNCVDTRLKGEQRLSQVPVRCGGDLTVQDGRPLCHRHHDPAGPRQTISTSQ